MSDKVSSHHLVSDKTLTRRNLEAAIAAAKMPVHFINCDMESVKLSHLDVSGFTFDRCTFIEADLSHITAIGTSWTSCRSRKTKLQGADLSDATFKAGDWNNTDWLDAQLAGASLTGLKLTGASFLRSRILGCTFTDCLMASAYLCGMSFRKSILGRCDMSRADLRRCDFRDAVFAEGSSIAHAQIGNALFEGADLRKVDIAGHGPGSLPILKGARISLAQAASIIGLAGLKVG